MQNQTQKPLSQKEFEATMTSITLNVKVAAITNISNYAREVSVSPLALTANILQVLTLHPSLLQEVLDLSDFYQNKLTASLHGA